jgi:hypothetical protein
VTVGDLLRKKALEHPGRTVLFVGDAERLDYSSEFRKQYRH